MGFMKEGVSLLVSLGLFYLFPQNPALVGAILKLAHCVGAIFVIAHM